MRIIFIVCVFILSFSFSRSANGTTRKLQAIPSKIKGRQDSLRADTSKKRIDKQKQRTQTVETTENSNMYPAATLQQYMKGKAAGLYIQEPSGEPGTYQYMFIRGTTNPLLNNEGLIKTQPLVVLDGLPIISNESPIAFDIQQYDYNRIGPATNLLSGIKIDDIESIEVFKDLSQTAIYGPRGANGVIYIHTKKATQKTRVSLNSYFGMVARPTVTTFNGNTENIFRQGFYTRYANAQQVNNYPKYLKDSLTNIYYGPSNWTDSYYGNAAIYNVDASFSGGSDRANFKFTVGSQKSSGNADNTSLSKYNTSAIVNIIPRSWLLITADINASKVTRIRNKSNRDRFAEVRYLPELSQAPAPNLTSYNNFLAEYDKTLDDNTNSIANGFLNINIKQKGFIFNTRFGASYNEGNRDLFYPSTLMDNVNYVSNYFGYSQRLSLESTLSYKYSINKNHSVDFIAGQSILWDKDRYNYAYAYNGPNDYLKVNLIDKNLLPTVYDRRLIAKFLDGTQNNLVSFFGVANYTYKNIYTASLLLRSDGSSNAQPTNRWFYSPVLSGSWNIKNDKFKDVSFLSSLKLNASIGRLGVVELNDKYALGASYVSDIGWSGEPRISSFLQISTLSRSYTYGYSGYNIPWAYNQQLSLGLDFGLWKNRLTGNIDFYSTTTKDQLLAIPSGSEYGYTAIYNNGMDINNTGVDLGISAGILTNPNKLQWRSSINLNINRNKLKALPNGLTSVEIGDRKLEVGKSVDQFWLLKNNGIYKADSEVPINPSTGLPLAYKGIALKAGDPKWEDTNGDYNVDDKDKSLKGHFLPVMSGGLNNSFQYKKWNLQTDFYFNLGREIINSAMANRFNFINNESANSISSVKEITFWQKNGDDNNYPRYNPWSSVLPYRVEQDLFLENASFIKLRTISLGYTFTSKATTDKNKNKFKSIYVYTSVNNIFTLTPYSGRDPELVNYTGYDTGYGLPIPVTYTAGIKVEF